MSQASALGRQILDLTVILIPLCFEKPSHAAPHLNHTFLNCLFFFKTSSTLPWFSGLVGMVLHG